MNTYKLSFALLRSNFFGRNEIHVSDWWKLTFRPLFLQACRDFLDLAETHSRRWQRALQYEREQRTHLEETIEQLAKQHNSLERAWREAPTLATSTPSTTTTTQGESEAECSFSADFTFLVKVKCHSGLNIMEVYCVSEQQSFKLNHFSVGLIKTKLHI